MKTIIAVLAMSACLSANAEVIMKTMNKGGGSIVLTDEKCKTKGHIAYATHPESTTMLGCWINDKAAIHILWEGKTLRSYDYDGWEIVSTPDVKGTM